MNSQADMKSNLATCEEQIREATKLGATLIVLPENFAYFGSDPERARMAEAIDDSGPIVGWLQRVADELSVTLVGGGFPERSPEPGRPFNTCLVVGDQGQIVGRYRKLHLFDATLPDGSRYAESAATHPGDEVVVVPVEGTRVGLSVCYDVRFPELYRQHVRAGAEIVVVAAAFTERTGRDHWHVLLRARAIENQVWVLASNQWGSHPGGRHCYGHSLIVDPWGRVRGEVSDGVGVAVAPIDLAELAEIRRLLPCLEHVR